MMNIDLPEWVSYAPYIIAGAWVTLQYTFLAVGFGFIIAIVLSLCRLSGSKVLKGFAKVYISVIRGTPVLVQLSIVYFALPQLIGLELSVFTSGVVAFALNSGAYLSESIRAGIQSVGKGQIEAAQALGVSKVDQYRDIILPQAIKNILPALVNEIVNMLKESAIIATIGGADLMRRAQVVAAEKYTYLEPLLIAAGCYYVLVVIFTILASRLEKRMSVYDSN